MIPKNIFQTYKTSALIEELALKTRKVKSLNPDYRYCFYDDEECRTFLLWNFPGSVLKAFDDVIPGAYKADLFRYCVLYKMGGFYLDVKCDLQMSYDSILSQVQPSDILLTDESQKFNLPGYYWNGFLACEPYHPILKKLIELSVKNIFARSYGRDVLSITGCGLFPQVENMIRPFHHPFALSAQHHGVILKPDILIASTQCPKYRLLQKKESSHYSLAWRKRKVYQDKSYQAISFEL